MILVCLLSFNKKLKFKIEVNSSVRNTPYTQGVKLEESKLAKNKRFLYMQDLIFAKNLV